MATTLEIIQGISQAVANAYDGSHIDRYNADGEARVVGLKREEGNPITDPRVIDGFNVKFHGNKLQINYHSEIQLKEVYGTDFEHEMDRIISEVSSFLKKEYKKITGNTLQLTAEGEVDVLVQNVSRRWSFVQANKFFKIGGLDGVVAADEPSGEDNPAYSLVDKNIKTSGEERLQESIKNFLRSKRSA